MNFELTREEAILLARVIVGWDPQTVADADLLVLLARRLCALPVPLESDEPQGTALPGASSRQAQLVPSGVSDGRAQSSDEPQRATQSKPVEQTRMSAGKYDRNAVEQITLTPTKCERKESANGPYIAVMWPSRGRGYLYANCWDPELFAWVAGRVKQESTFYVVHKGKFTDIVGVRA